ncbi:transposase [Kiritimatiellaeota bacterium B1221]|nr:transposase [Kiritimatiellaeota bacterium B1221]
MPQSLSHVIVHTVFSTKNRQPLLKELGVRNETFAYLGAAVNTLGCQSFLVGGYVDHIHILSTLSRSISQADFVKEVKRSSSIWFKDEFREPSFSWQKGYGIFSVSESRVPDVKAYIQNQEVHHGKLTFQDEFRQLLRAHNLAFDEKYVWD